MNIIITIITLIILLILINYLTNGKFKYLFNKYILEFTSYNKKKNNNIKKKISNNVKTTNINDTDLDDDINNIYNFLNNLINQNYNTYELIKFNSERLNVDKTFKNIILNYINKICNSSYFIFYNIELINDLYYYDNKNGKYIEIFKFTAHITNKIKQQYIGKLVFVMELFIDDLNKNIIILNFNLLGKIKNEDNNDPYSFEEFFIKADSRDKSNQINDTEGSLYVPSIINISDTTE